MAAGAGLDGDAKRFAGLGQPLTSVAEIAQGGPLEAGKLMQHRNDALAIMLVGRRDVDRQRETILIDREMDFDALADSSLEGNTGAFFSMIGVGDLVQQGIEDLVGSSVSMALARS